MPPCPGRVCALWKRSRSRGLICWFHCVRAGSDMRLDLLGGAARAGIPPVLACAHVCQCQADSPTCQDLCAVAKTFFCGPLPTLISRPHTPLSRFPDRHFLPGYPGYALYPCADGYIERIPGETRQITVWKTGIWGACGREISVATDGTKHPCAPSPSRTRAPTLHAQRPHWRAPLLRPPHPAVPLVPHPAAPLPRPTQQRHCRTTRLALRFMRTGSTAGGGILQGIYNRGCDVWVRPCRSSICSPAL